MADQTPADQTPPRPSVPRSPRPRPARSPDREAMSLVNANLAIPINAAVAANVLSDGSIAYADATQQPDIDQAT